jgi:hypothetical protein
MQRQPGVPAARDRLARRYPNVRIDDPDASSDEGSLSEGSCLIPQARGSLGDAGFSEAQLASWTAIAARLGCRSGTVPAVRRSAAQPAIDWSADGQFLAVDCFSGHRPGAAFKLGEFGLGYYRLQRPLLRCSPMVVLGSSAEAVGTGSVARGLLAHVCNSAHRILGATCWLHSTPLQTGGPHLLPAVAFGGGSHIRRRLTAAGHRA